MENVYPYRCTSIFNLTRLHCCCPCVGTEPEKKIKKGRGLLKAYGNPKKPGSLGGVPRFARQFGLSLFKNGWVIGTVILTCDVMCLKVPWVNRYFASRYLVTEVWANFRIINQSVSRYDYPFLSSINLENIGWLCEPMGTFARSWMVTSYLYKNTEPHNSWSKVWTNTGVCNPLQSELWRLRLDVFASYS